MWMGVWTTLYCAEIRDASYIGLTSGQIKDRITSHRQTFREKEKQNSTTLSKFIWSNNLNRDDTGNLTEPSIKWSILQQSDTYKPGQKHCNLCLSEKLFIISNINKPNNINKCTDVATICIHKQKHYLNAITWTPLINGNPAFKTLLLTKLLMKPALQVETYV